MQHQAPGSHPIYQEDIGRTGQQLAAPLSLSQAPQMPRPAPQSPRPAVCNSCSRIFNEDVTHLCTFCSRHWCIDCLVLHLQQHRRTPGCSFAVPCMGKVVGCAASLPSAYLESFAPNATQQMSPSSSLCSTESTFSELNLPAQQGTGALASSAWPASSSRLSAEEQLQLLVASMQPPSTPSTLPAIMPASMMSQGLLGSTDPSAPSSYQGSTIGNRCCRPLPGPARTCYSCLPEGASCLHAHSAQELQAGLAASSRKPCRHWADQGHCAFEARPPSMQPPLEGRPSSAKKVICKFWWEGRCTKGAACPYAHGKGELRHAGAFRTSMCPHLLKGAGCPNGDCCTYAHHSSELVRHPCYKTRMCKAHLLHGCCPRGDQCHYAHDACELQGPPA